MSLPGQVAGQTHDVFRGVPNQIPNMVATRIGGPLALLLALGLFLGRFKLFVLLEDKGVTELCGLAS